MIIKNGNVYTKNFQFDSLTISTKENLIYSLDTAPVNPDDTQIYDASDCYVIPGLTDIHFHGCVGHDFCDGTKEAIHAMAEYELKNGITTISPWIVTIEALDSQKVILQ